MKTIEVAVQVNGKVKAVIMVYSQRGRDVAVLR